MRLYLIAVMIVFGGLTIDKIVDLIDENEAVHIINLIVFLIMFGYSAYLLVNL